MKRLTTEMKLPSGASDLDVRKLRSFVDAMARGDVRVIEGLDTSGLADLLAVDAPACRPVLLFNLGLRASATQIIEAAIEQLARAVGDLWPFLWSEDFSALHDDALSRAHLPIRLAEISARLPELSQAWAKEIALRALRGRAPRLHEPSLALEWAQLVLAFSGSGLTIATPLGPRETAESWIRAVEWLADHADVRLVILADAVPSGTLYQRISFGARRIAFASTRRPSESSPAQAGLDRQIFLSLPETEGQPHPQSAAEMRLYTMIQADPELRPLFVFNRTVPNVELLQARVDVLWFTGRIVVEIDGPEHRGAAKYRADRHRDYRLMCAGYRVLRVTNEDVIADAALTLEKIRDVVRLVREGEP